MEQISELSTSDAESTVIEVERLKYGRTFHLPFSLGASSDDKILKSTSHFEGHEVVVTEKMDGENSTCYWDGFTHARSIDSSSMKHRSWLRMWWSVKSYMLEEGLRICGENMYARHSIQYDDLESYFYGFSVWKGDTCWDWDETVRLFNSLIIYHPKILFRGIYDEKAIKKIAESIDTKTCEGFVVRKTCGFTMSEFETSIAKWVRPNHVTTDKHWMHSEIVPNKLKGS